MLAQVRNLLLIETYYISKDKPHWPSNDIRCRCYSPLGTEDRVKHFLDNGNCGEIKPLMVFYFLPKNVHFTSRNAISCLFLKNVSPSKTVVCFILKNLHVPIMEGIAFFALHKSRVLIIPYKADDFCLFIGLPDEI